MTSRAGDVFLDRDGVLLREIDGYVTSVELAELLPGAAGAVARLSQRGHRVIVITNQSPVGRGLMSRTMVDAIHSHIASRVEDAGGRIDHFLICPHHPAEGCACRKPKPGLLFQAESELDTHLPSAVVVGDQPSDIQAAQAAGCRPILVLCGQTVTRPALAQVEVAADLPAAVDLILRTR